MFLECSAGSPARSSDGSVISMIALTRGLCSRSSSLFMHHVSMLVYPRVFNLAGKVAVDLSCLFAIDIEYSVTFR